MDIRTLILALAVGSFLFGLALMLFSYRKESSRRIPFWVAAKFLQGSGSLLLYFRDALPDFATILLANSLLLLGCAYEGWAVFHITGRAVSRRLHLSAALGIVAACLVLLRQSPPNQMAGHFFVHTIFYALPGWALLSQKAEKSLLRCGLGGSFLLLALLFLLRSLWALFFPAEFDMFFGTMIHQVMLPAVYCMMLISGFCMLLLAKEKSDQELHEALRDQKAILQTLPTGLCIVRDRIVDRCNPSMERMFGYAPGALIGRHVGCLYENEDECERQGQAVYRQIGRDDRFVGEMKLVRRNGERIWTWVEGTTIFQDRPQSYSVFSVTDITQQKVQQEILARQKEELEAATRSKNRFLKMVAHEFRTPLGLLASSVDILGRYWERLTEEERNNQNNRIRSASQQISSLVDSVFSYNHSEAEAYEPSPKLVEVETLCRSIAAETEAVWSRGHCFQLCIAQDCGKALLDETLFRRVLQNLLSNAFRYTEPEGRVSLVLKRLDGRLFMEISDSGIGIDEEDRKRIFESHFRGRNVGTRRGLGLGLSIVKEALAMMDGAIETISGKGEGTRMLVEIPALDGNR